MKKVYLISKCRANKNWSDSIENQFEYISRNYSKQYKVTIIYFNKNLVHNLKLAYKIFTENHESLILVHHTICLWPFFLINIFKRLDKKKCKIFSLLHEGEIAFSKKYNFNNFKCFISSCIRSSYLYHKIPQSITFKTFVLTTFQKDILNLKNAEVINFLGVDLYDDLSINNTTKFRTIGKGCRTILFPFNPSRKEKGFYKIINSTAFCRIIYPFNTPHKDMYHLYDVSDIVVIPSVEFETYSLALIEAFLMNKIIIASNKLGLIINILRYHRKTYFEKKGLFIIDVEKCNVTEFIKTILDKNITPSTLDIYNEFKLDVKSTTKNVMERICNE